jgi:hypothetical protein
MERTLSRIISDAHGGIITNSPCTGHSGSPFREGDFCILVFVRLSVCGLKQQRRQHNDTGYYYSGDGIFVGDHTSLSFRFVGVGSWVFSLDAVAKCGSSLHGVSSYLVIAFTPESVNRMEKSERQKSIF